MTKIGPQPRVHFARWRTSNVVSHDRTPLGLFTLAGLIMRDTRLSFS